MTDDQANEILSNRWPEAQIGDRQLYGGRGHEYMLTETGWVHATDEEAQKIEAVTAAISDALDPLSPEARANVVRKFAKIVPA